MTGREAMYSEVGKNRAEENCLENPDINPRTYRNLESEK